MTAMPAWLGFQFDEIMSGTWTPAGATTPQRLEFAISSSAASLGHFLRTGEMTCRGHIDVAGLAEHAACRGVLVMPVRGRYVDINLRFTAADGRPLRYSAMKKLSLKSFVHDITTFIGSINDEGGRVLGRSVARFDLRRNTSTLLRSLRLRNVEPMAPELLPAMNGPP